MDGNLDFVQVRKLKSLVLVVVAAMQLQEWQKMESKVLISM